MNYQEMVDALISMNEQQRRMALKAHWEVAFSDSFIAYVQGQLEEGRKLVDSNSDTFKKLFDGVNPEVVDVLKMYSTQHLNNLHQVWNCMSVVYQDLQRQSERQGNTGGMVSHGNHRVMPRGKSVSSAIHCYRCGSQAVDQGLCSGCLSTQKSWEQDNLDHDNQLLEQQRQQLDYQRLQDDQLYNNQQQDFNTYTNYHNDY